MSTMYSLSWPVLRGHLATASLLDFSQLGVEADRRCKDKQDDVDKLTFPANSPDDMEVEEEFDNVEDEPASPCSLPPCELHELPWRWHDLIEERVATTQHEQTTLKELIHAAMGLRKAGPTNAKETKAAKDAAAHKNGLGDLRSASGACQSDLGACAKSEHHATKQLLGESADKHDKELNAHKDSIESLQPTPFSELPGFQETHPQKRESRVARDQFFRKAEVDQEAEAEAEVNQDAEEKDCGRKQARHLARAERNQWVTKEEKAEKEEKTLEKKEEAKPGGNGKKAALCVELEELKTSALRKRAQALGASEKDLEAADDAHSARDSFIGLIMATAKDEHPCAWGANDDSFKPSFSAGSTASTTASDHGVKRVLGNSHDGAGKGKRRALTLVKQLEEELLALP